MKKLVSAVVLSGTVILSGGVASAQYGGVTPPEPQTSTTTTEVEVLPVVVTRPAPAAVASGSLARTGDDTMPAVLGGAALVAVGTTFVVASRRRRGAHAA